MPTARAMTTTALQPALAEHLTWMRLRGLRASSMVSRRQTVLRLARALPVEVLQATADDLDRWQRRLRLSDVSRSNEISQVVSFYNWCVTSGRLAESPTSLLIRPKLPRQLPRPISEAELTVAIANAPRRIRPWLVLAAYAGLRAREIALLERDAILDLADPPVILIADGKGGRQRVIPASDFVIDELRLYGMPSRGVMFTRGDGQRGPNIPPRISHLANLYLHSVGITATLHQLRHRFGSQLYRVSVDLRLVQECMGHSSPATTAGYVAWSHAKAAAAVNALASP